MNKELNILYHEIIGAYDIVYFGHLKYYTRIEIRKYDRTKIFQRYKIIWGVILSWIKKSKNYFSSIPMLLHLTAWLDF